MQRTVLRASQRNHHQLSASCAKASHCSVVSFAIAPETSFYRAAHVAAITNTSTGPQKAALFLASVVGRYALHG